MSEKICMTTKEFEDIASDVASDIAAHIYRHAKSRGDSEKDSMLAAEGAIAMLSDFVGGIKERVENTPLQDFPRGFICPEEFFPKRATNGSAGYDFVAPYNVSVPPNGVATIYTGIRAYMLPDEVLKIYPRSSMAIRRGVTLLNDVAIIDSDFKGEIVLSLHNRSMITVTIKKGEKIAQGIFQKYLTCGDEPSVVRNGGIGSTGK